MEEFTKDRKEWSKESLKRIDFINERWRKQRRSVDNIKDLEQGILEYYRFFVKK